MGIILQSTWVQARSQHQINNQTQQNIHQIIHQLMQINTVIKTTTILQKMKMDTHIMVIQEQIVNMTEVEDQHREDIIMIMTKYSIKLDICKQIVNTLIKHSTFE